MDWVKLGIKKSSLRLALALPVLGIISALASLYLLDAYQYGDQAVYRRFYFSLPGASLSDIPLLQAGYTGSAEPLFGLTMWIGSNAGLSKDAYITFFNVVLFLSLVVYLRKNKASWLFIILAITNYYFIVILTGAERLKFSYLAVILGATLSGSLRWSFFVAAPFLHFQTILLYGGLACGKIAHIRVTRRVRMKNIALFLAGVILVAGLVFGLARYSSSITGKLEAYARDSLLIGELLKALALTVTALIVLPRKWEAGYVMAACLAVIAIVGPERANMIAVTAFLFLVVKHGKTRSPLVLALMAYLSYKSIDFVETILLYGDGYAR